MFHNHQKGTQVNHTARSARTPFLRTGLFGVDSGGSNGVWVGEGTALLRQTASADLASAFARSAEHAHTHISAVSAAFAPPSRTSATAQGQVGQATATRPNGAMV
jgi:hypothetical protein